MDQMNLALLAVLIALLGFILTFYQTVMKRDTLKAEMTEKFSEVKSRVDILWSLLFRRGISDAVASGLLERQSPLKLNVDVLSGHTSLIEKIQEFYNAKGRKLQDLELLVELEKNFGQDLQRLCDETPGLLPGACLAAMVFMVRPHAELFEKFDTQSWKSLHDHESEGKTNG